MNIDEIKARLAKWQNGKKSPQINSDYFALATCDIADLIEAVEAAEKKSHEIWDALKEQTKELARAYTKIESLKEAVEARDKVIENMDFQSGCSWCEKNNEIRNKFESEIRK